VLLSKKQWHWRFCSTFTKEQSDALYERYCIPAPGRPLYQSAMSFFQRNPVIKVEAPREDEHVRVLIHVDKGTPVTVRREHIDITGPAMYDQYLQDDLAAFKPRRRRSPCRAAPR